MSVTFEIDSPDERDDFPSGAHRLKCIKYFNNSYEFIALDASGVRVAIDPGEPNVEVPLSSVASAVKYLEEALFQEAERHSPFAESLPTLAKIFESYINFEDPLAPEGYTAFRDGLKGLPNQDETISVAISEGLTRVEASLAALQEALNVANETPSFVLPEFIHHSTREDQIPDSVVISQFVQDPDGHSRGMANICRTTKVTISDLQSIANSERRSGFEDIYKKEISGQINNIWKQKKYAIEFEPLPNDRMGIFVSDNTYAARLRPSERSDGFQWLLSFYARLESDRTAQREAIVLLDNPAVELHLDGQRDIRKMLEAFDHQVIYVTHSPGLVDTTQLDRIRRIDYRGESSGSIVSDLLDGTNATDFLEPVRIAIGADLQSTLFSNKLNILVEGAADQPFIRAGLTAFAAPMVDSVTVNGPLASGTALVEFYMKNGLDFVCLVDADVGGKDLKKLLKKAGVPEQRTLDISVLGADFEGKEIEDLINGAFYHLCVVETFPNLVVGDEPPKGANDGKRTKAYSDDFHDRFGFGFSKRRVAETLRQRVEDGRFVVDELAHLGSLIVALLDAFEGGPPKPAAKSAPKARKAASDKQPSTKRKPQKKGRPFPTSLSA